MLTGKTISLKNIIAKVYRDLNLREETDFVNMYEWGAEALEQIGVFEQLLTKNVEITVANYKAELPVDLVYINNVDTGHGALLSSTNTFGPLITDQVPAGTTPAPLGLQSATYGGVDFLKTEDNYSVQGGFINLNFASGKILLSYQAMPADVEGYPLVPDDVSFREAVYRYIVYKYLYPKYIMGQIPAQVYYDAQEKWYWYCGQAGAKAQMPDLAKLESIKRNFLQLRPNPNHFQNFFNDLNKPRD